MPEIPAGIGRPRFRLLEDLCTSLPILQSGKTLEYSMRRRDALRITGADEGSSSLPCRIHTIRYHGSHFEITCLVKGMHVTVIKEKNKVIDNQWQENQEVYLSLKSYRIFDAEQGHQSIHQKLKELGYIE